MREKIQNCIQTQRRDNGIQRYLGGKGSGRRGQKFEYFTSRDGKKNTAKENDKGNNETALLYDRCVRACLYVTSNFGFCARVYFQVKCTRAYIFVGRSHCVMLKTLQQAHETVETHLGTFRPAPEERAFSGAICVTKYSCTGPCTS